MRDSNTDVRGCGAGCVSFISYASQAEAEACIEALHAASEWGHDKYSGRDGLPDTCAVVHAVQSSDYNTAPKGIIYTDIHLFVFLLVRYTCIARMRFDN